MSDIQEAILDLLAAIGVFAIMLAIGFAAISLV